MWLEYTDAATGSRYAGMLMRETVGAQSPYADTGDRWRVFNERRERETLAETAQTAGRPLAATDRLVVDAGQVSMVTQRRTTRANLDTVVDWLTADQMRKQKLRDEGPPASSAIAHTAEKPKDFIVGAAIRFVDNLSVPALDRGAAATTGTAAAAARGRVQRAAHVGRSTLERAVGRRQFGN